MVLHELKQIKCVSYNEEVVIWELQPTNLHKGLHAVHISTEEKLKRHFLNKNTAFRENYKSVATWKLCVHFM